MNGAGRQTEYVAIEPTPIASRFKRKKLRFSLLGFLMFMCFAGATLGIAGRQWLNERSAKRAEEADLAAFQGRWEIESAHIDSARALLIIIGNDFLVLPNGTGAVLRHGNIHIDATASPKTVTFRAKGVPLSPASLTTCLYSFKGDRLTLRLVGKSLPNGGYEAVKGDVSEFVVVRERPNASVVTNRSASK